MIIPKDPITRDEYFARVDAGVPYEGPVEGLGYALKEMVVTPTNTNKSKSRIFLNVNYLNIYIQTNQRDAIQTRDITNQVNAKQQQIEQEAKQKQREKECVSELKSKLEAYYKQVIETEKQKPGFNFKYQLALEAEKKKIMEMINYKNALYTHNAFPTTFRFQNLNLIIEVGSYRKAPEVLSIPKKNEQVKKDSPLERYHEQRKLMDPFATQMAEQQVIKAVAVGGLVITGAVGASALGSSTAKGAAWVGNTVWESGAINTSINTMAREGFLSLSSQLILEKGNIREVNVTSLLTDIFLTRYAGYAVGSIVEYKPFSEKSKEVKYIGNGLDLEETVIQIIGAYCIGKGFDYLTTKTLNPYTLKQYELYKDEILDLLESIISYQTGGAISTYYEELSPTKE